MTTTTSRYRLTLWISKRRDARRRANPIPFRGTSSGVRVQELQGLGWLAFYLEQYLARDDLAEYGAWVAVRTDARARGHGDLAYLDARHQFVCIERTVQEQLARRSGGRA